MKRFVLAAFMLLFAFSAYAENYAECLLDNLPGSANEASTIAATRLCTERSPNSFYEIEKGSGRGVFGYADGNACVLKEGKSTHNPTAGFMIGAACRCLYDKGFEGEMCAYRERAIPTPVAAEFLDKPAPIRAETIQVQPKIAAAQKSPTPQPQPKFDAKLQKEMDEVSSRAVEDYPFLDTPEGAEVLSKIVMRRDMYIRGGSHPPLALQRAINDYSYDAATNAMRPVNRRAPDPIPEVPTTGCRWVTPQKWSCK